MVTDRSQNSEGVRFMWSRPRILRCIRHALEDAGYYDLPDLKDETRITEDLNLSPKEMVPVILFIERRCNISFSPADGDIRNAAEENAASMVKTIGDLVDLIMLKKLHK